ncbi:MAG: hypothetical protein PHT69_13675 [Bacteroidales bacterium]|nr:hypothetical protein [Bacteroidales bacterium]
MIVIAESGSTKTDWCIYNTKTKMQNHLQTIGINPYFIEEHELIACLKEAFINFEIKHLKQFFFYGAGCANSIMQKKLEGMLSKLFINAEIKVESDLLAAARGCFGQREGLICILGTGSNSGIFKNDSIIETLPSLGYVFGDEGSGAFMGKVLLTDFMNNDMPKAVKIAFQKAYNININHILEQVYSNRFPNRYLASFSQFINDNLSFAYCRTLVNNAFDAFFEKRLLKHTDAHSYPLKFVGSVAFSFSSILTKVALQNNWEIDTEKDIVKSPLEGLIDYHTRSI